MIARKYAVYTGVSLPTHTPSHTHTHTLTQEGYWFRKILQEEPFEHSEAQKHSNDGCEHISALREPEYGGMYIPVLQPPHKVKLCGCGEIQQLCCGGKS